MKITKFKYFKESNQNKVTHLKDAQYFKDYFMDLIDEDYTIEIKSHYVGKYKHDDEEGGIYFNNQSKFPKKGYYPEYQITLSPKDSKYVRLINPEAIASHISILSIFNNCFNNLVHDNNDFIINEAVYINSYQYPLFEFSIVDHIEIVDSELPDEFFNDFVQNIENYISYKYDSITTIEKNDKDKTITLTINGSRPQVNVILRDINYLRKEKTWRDTHSFDLVEVTHKKPYILKISNIKNVKATEK